MRSGAFFVLAAGAALLTLSAFPVGLLAQEPDTIPLLRPQLPDTLGRPAAQDTLTQDTVPADTLGPPPPTLPPLDPLGPAAWSRGVWEWDRLALRRLPDLSLLQLLERIPGVVPVRADIVNQPESAAVFGAAAGAIRYVIDGFELDPLVSPTFDPSRLPLLGLERVRVERRVTGATVHIETLSPDHPRTRTVVEAATGDFGVNLFRGVFLAPSVLGGPLSGGFERLASGGAIGGGSNHLNGWLKWSWVRDSAGVQVEYRQSDMDRSGVGDGAGEGEGLSSLRRDWTVRARGARGRLTGEVYAGASQVEDERGAVEVREGAPQGGVRLRSALDAPFPLEARAALRLRDHPRLPFGELDVELRAVPHRLAAVEAQAGRGWWSEGPATGDWRVRAQGGPLLGLSVFAELFNGSPLLGDGSTIRFPAAASSPLRLTRDGLRAGAELRYGGLVVGGAAIRTTADTVSAFGLPSEGTFPRLGAGEATGFELMARLPTGWDPLTVQGWYSGTDAPTPWLYLPQHHWRVGLVYHHFPLPSGNAELFGRIEHVFRGRMRVPVAASTDAEAAVAPVAVGAYRATNLELTIRVLTVRAFLRWENIMNRHGQQDLPGFTRPGQHVLYGVKWEFLN